MEAVCSYFGLRGIITVIIVKEKIQSVDVLSLERTSKLIISNKKCYIILFVNDMKK